MSGKIFPTAQDAENAFYEALERYARRRAQRRVDRLQVSQHIQCRIFGPVSRGASCGWTGAGEA